jgi:hypothetical protein
LVLAILPWLSYLFETVEIPGIGKFGLRKYDVAKKYIPTENIEENANEIKYGEQSILTKQAIEIPPLLYFKARINYSHEAGSHYLMKILVNEQILTPDMLVNKPTNKKIQDGREKQWFNQNNGSWALRYSPDFKQNYFHPKYKVVNGDPYIFIFNLSNITPKQKKLYEIKIEHIGLKGNEAFKNSLIIKDLFLF